MRPENSRAGCALGHARRCYITAEFSLAQALGFALLVQKTDRSRQAPFLLRAVALSLQWAVASLASAEPAFAQLVLLPIVLKAGPEAASGVPGERCVGACKLSARRA